jgi:transposase
LIPEVLLRILLLGYLYGITSERKLLEELRMRHLAWGWFTELGFEQEIPHHSTFSKNRHGRFEESNLFQELFERIVEQCMAAGLVEGEQHGEREPPQSYPPPTSSRRQRK